MIGGDTRCGTAGHPTQVTFFCEPTVYKSFSQRHC
jgi:hypothetical protein